MDILSLSTGTMYLIIYTSISGIFTRECLDYLQIHIRTILREIWVVLTGTYRDCLQGHIIAIYRNIKKPSTRTSWINIQGHIGTDYRDILGLHSDILELSNKDVLGLSPGAYWNYLNRVTY